MCVNVKYSSSIVLRHWRQILPKFETNIVRCTGPRRNEAYPLSLLVGPAINYYSPHLALSPPTSQVEKAIISFIHGKDGAFDKEEVGLPAFYALAKWMEPNTINTGSPGTALYSSRENTHIVDKRHPPYDYHDRRGRMTGMRFWNVRSPSSGP